MTADSCAEYSSISCTLSLWMRLCVDRECIILILVTYTMIKYVETEKIATPLKLRHFALTANIPYSTLPGYVPYQATCHWYLRVPGRHVMYIVYHIILVE